MKNHFFLELKSGKKLEVMVEGRGGKNKQSTVLLVPGLHSDLHEWGLFDDISQRLAQKEFQVFRFSFSGSGQSQGNVYDITLTRQVDELKQVLEYILKQSTVDKKRLGLLAQSFGVPTTMAALPLPVKSLVFTSGAYYPRKAIARLFEDLGAYNPSGDSYINADYDSMKIGPQLWQDLKKYNLQIKLREQKQPLFILHGKKDFIPWQWAKETFTEANEPKKLAIHPEAEHGFDDKPEYFEWLMVRVESWFEKTLI